MKFPDNILETITERDIDLLLIEEFTVSKEFSNWFYKQVYSSNDKLSEAQASHSIIDNELGETDILVVYPNKHVILIENKINALSQTDQGIRYTLRGKKGIQDGTWKEFRTCIVAPTLYLESSSDVDNYSTNISYENIATYFNQKKKLRYKYKAYIITSAIYQNKRGYSPVIDDKTTIFWNKYWQYVRKYFSYLNMKKPSQKPIQATWIYFKPANFNSKLRIIHKLNQGYLDLEVSDGCSIYMQLKEILPKNVNLITTGKAAVIRNIVDTISLQEPFETQTIKISNALSTAKELIKYATIISNNLENFHLK